MIIATFLLPSSDSYCKTAENLFDYDFILAYIFLLLTSLFPFAVWLFSVPDDRLFVCSNCQILEKIKKDISAPWKSAVIFRTSPHTFKLYSISFISNIILHAWCRNMKSPAEGRVKEIAEEKNLILSNWKK